MNIEIFVTDANNMKIVSECEKISFENQLSQGGTLKFMELYKDSKFIVYCAIQQKIVGYVYLSENFLCEDSLYIEQIAIKKEFQSMGLGTKMINYICLNFNQFKYLTSNVRQDNFMSLNFHKKNGFEVFGENQYGLSLRKQLSKN